MSDIFIGEDYAPMTDGELRIIIDTNKAKRKQRQLLSPMDQFQSALQTDHCFARYAKPSGCKLAGFPS